MTVATRVMVSRTAPGEIWCSALLYLLVSGLAVWRSLPWWTPVYANTAWWIDYEQGFVKRGLLGEVLRQWELVPDAGLIRGVSLSLTAAVWLLFTCLFWRLYRHSGFDRGVAWLALLFAASSATLQHMVLDEGRLDMPALALVLLAMGVVQGLRQGALLFAVVTGLACLALWGHEASLLLFIPPLLSWWVYRHGRAGWGWYGAFVACMALNMALVLGLGERDGGLLEQDFARQQELAGGWLVRDSFAVVYGGSLQQNWAWVLERVTARDQLLAHLALAVFCIVPYGWLGGLWLRQLQRIGQARLLWMCVPALAALGLYAVAIDFYRWWAWAVFNLHGLTLLLCLCDRRACVSLCQVLRTQGWVVAWLVLSSLYLGGLGWDVAYPLAGLARP